MCRQRREPSCDDPNADVPEQRCKLNIQTHLAKTQRAAGRRANHQRYRWRTTDYQYRQDEECLLPQESAAEQNQDLLAKDSKMDTYSNNTEYRDTHRPEESNSNRDTTISEMDETNTNHGASNLPNFSDDMFIDTHPKARPGKNQCQLDCQRYAYQWSQSVLLEGGRQ